MVGWRRDSLFDNGRAWTEGGLTELGEKIVAWAEGPSEYPTLTGFTIENPQEISIGNLRQLKHRYPFFKEYCQDAERILAAKMAKRSFEGKASPWILKTYVTMYDEEVKEHTRAEQAAEFDEREAAKERHGTAQGVDVQTLADLIRAADVGELKQE